MNRTWWKEAVVYQIYPRSFKDSNGDGIGDIKGIIEKLEYINHLGCDVIWLCPIYDSPNDDNGYDIRDYRAVMKEFGTMEDFKNLLSAAHTRGIKIVMDLVVNHTSDEHKWFVESKASKESPYRDFYIWREGKDKSSPNNWGSVFGGPAWKYSKETEMYYLHLFSPKQPDLNWDNPKLRDAVYNMMEFWLDMGVDGFRMDVISYISKNSLFPDGRKIEEDTYGNFEPYVVNGPNIHKYLREMNDRVLSRYDTMTVGETPGVSVEDAKNYAGFGKHELNMIFQFEHMDIDNGEYGKWSENRFKLSDLKRVLTKWQKGLEGKAWNSLYWNNHDRPRVVSRFGCTETTELWDKSAKMLATCLHMLQGTPYIFQGEEIGMTNIAFDNLEDYRDIETLNAYREMVTDGNVEHNTMMRYIYKSSRDNARTPMQWNGQQAAGFTTGIPWIKVNPNYKQINVENQIKDQNSVFNFYRRLIELRKELLIIAYGTYDIVENASTEEEIYAYTRTLDQQKLVVINSFSKESVYFDEGKDIPIEKGKLILTNYDEGSFNKDYVLRPYESRVYLINVQKQQETYN